MNVRVEGSKWREVETANAKVILVVMVVLVFITMT